MKIENLKIEKWNGHEIRFVFKNGEWWAVAKDVAVALGYDHTPSMVRRLDEDERNTVRLTHSKRGNPNTTVISEAGIYEAIFGSKRDEAKEFKRWIKQVIKQLRHQSGLEGFQVFRMLDKEHQKQMMSQVNQIKQVERKHFIKANTIANKTVSDLYGFPKMIKKTDMTPEMLKDRQPILEDTVKLMQVKDEYDLDISVSKSVKKKYVDS